MKPPPPTPHENGSVTPSTAAAATAASTAVPPFFSMSMPACEASRSTVAAAPPVPVDVGGSDDVRVGADDATPASASTPATSAAATRRDGHERIGNPLPGAAPPSTTAPADRSAHDS